jgi:hypothetical protein
MREIGHMEQDDGPDEDVIIASIGVFCGRPDPNFGLTSESVNRFASLVKATMGKERANAPPRALPGSYHGFYVQTPADLAQRLRIPTLVISYRGLLIEGLGSRQNYWRDVADIESLLIAQAREQGHADVLTAFEIGSSKGVRP